MTLQETTAQKLKSINERIRKNIKIFSLPVVLLIVAMLHFGSVNNELNGLGGDNAHYILLAKSIATGQGYIGVDNKPHIHFPPGFPLLLTPAYLLFGINISAFHIVVVLSELIALYFLLRYLSLLWGWVPALIIGGSFALNPFTYLSLVRILTEFPYLMVTCLILFLAEVSRQKDVSRWLDILWLPALVTFSYFIRVAGVSLIVSYFLYRVLRREWKILAWNLPLILVPPLFWKVRHLLIGGETGNVSLAFMRNAYDPAQGTITFSDLLTRITGNIQNLSTGTTTFIFPYLENPHVVITSLVVIVLIIGLTKSWLERRESLVNIYLPVFMGMLLVWPFYEPRKILPVMPFIFYFFFMGLVWFADFIQGRFRQSDQGKLKFRWSTGVLVLSGAMVVAGQVPETLDIKKAQSRPMHYPPVSAKAYEGFTVDWSHFREAHYWRKSGMITQNARPWADFLFISRLAKDLTPPDSVIISRKPSLTALYSERPALVFPFYRDHEQQRSFILEEKVDFILLDGMFRDTYNYLVPYIQANQGAFKIIQRSNNAYLLKVNRNLL